MKAFASSLPRNFYFHLALTVILSFAARIWIFAHRLPWITADTFTYLNCARMLRGEEVPSGFDHLALAPRDDQGARAPGYPIFLNLAFALSGWKGTPGDVLHRITRERKPTPIELDDWHGGFLRSKENIRSAQLLQHLLGVLASVLAFGLLWQWTRCVWVASLGALIAVGLRPNWLLTYERALLTEALAATLVLAFFWFIAQAQEKDRWKWLLFASTVGSALALTRPNFAFASLLLCLAEWMHKERRDWRNFVAVLLPFFILVVGWVAQNGLRYGIWNVTTWVGVISYHFQDHPEAFSDPVLREELEKRKGDYRAMAHALGDLIEKWGVSFPQAQRRLVAETKQAALKHPEIFTKSVISGLMTHYLSFFRASPRWGALRWILGILLFAMTVAGLVAPFVSGAPSLMRFAVAFVVCNSFVAALFIDSHDQGRLAFPVESQLTLQAIWLLWRGVTTVRQRKEGGLKEVG